MIVDLISIICTFRKTRVMCTNKTENQNGIYTYGLRPALRLS